jgi:hypothetical protein
VSAPAFSWWTTGDGVSSPLRPRSWVAATSAPASTPEQFPEESRIDSARVMLRADSQGS